MKGLSFLKRGNGQDKGERKAKAKAKGKKPVKSKEKKGAQKRRVNPLIKYFRETRSEVKKVTWPTRNEATNLTMIVVAVTVAMSAALGLIDFIFAQLFNVILSI